MTALSPTALLPATSTSISSTVISEVNIEYGRRKFNEHCAPSVCTLELLNPISTNIELGVQLRVSAGANVRFLGNIDSIVARKYTTTITAISAALGSLANSYSAFGYGPTVTGGTASDAVTYAFSDAQNETIGGFPAGLTFTASYTDTFDPGPDCGPLPPYGQYETGSALDYLNLYADTDPTGYLLEVPGTQDVQYHDNRYRSTVDTFTLPADIIISEWERHKDYTDIVNAMSVEYFIYDPSSPYLNWANTKTETMVDAASVTARGNRQQNATIYASDVAVAQRLATIRLAQRSTPRWSVGPLTVDVRAATAGTTTSLMAATVGTRIGTPYSSYISSFPASCYIEGWTERITNSTHFMDLYISDYLLTQRQEQWADVAPALTYAATSGTLKWSDLFTTTI